MFKVKKNYIGKVATANYAGDIKNASQETLKYLFDQKHEGVEKAEEKKEEAPKEAKPKASKKKANKENKSEE